MIAWLILRQWPQALLAAVLVPWCLGGEWAVATEGYRGAWSIAAQGLLLLSILYLSTTRKESNRPLRIGLTWLGVLNVLPFISDVVLTSEQSDYRWRWWHQSNLPAGMKLFGYVAAYAPVLIMAAITRKKRSMPMFAAAGWVFVLALVSAYGSVESNPWLYLWIAIGACALCYWGVVDNRKLFINYGTAIFAINLIGFYFSSVLDKLGRSMGLILLGVIFLAGGWVLNRLRTDLIARAATAGANR